MDKDILTTYRVDHLPMVAQFIEDIGLINLIDSQAGIHANEILTTGQATAAMVVMALGFVSRPTYLSPQFFESKALNLIIGKNKTGNMNVSEILPEHLNDDKLGRTLDEIYDLGPDTLFQTIAFAAARKEKLKVPTLHEDTTSHSFYGAYEGEEATGVTGDAYSTEPCHARIEYGFSKDKRQDCKQLVQELLVSSDGDVPLMVKIHSGNASDVKVFQERVKQLKQQFAEAEDLMPEFIVADSKFYNEENILSCVGDVPKWITRVPDNILEAKSSFIEAYRSNSWKEMAVEGNKSKVRYHEVEVERYGVLQRMIVVNSDAGLTRAKKTIERQLKAEQIQLEKEIKKLSKQHFACEADALAASQLIFEKKKYHLFEQAEISGKAISCTKKGRPKKGEVREVVYCAVPQYKASSREELLQTEYQKGTFIVGTNDLVAPAEKIISIYRKDQQGVERAFRFLKSPTYFADAFFFKNTKRIVALITIMTISLLVYSLLQRKLRKTLEEKNETVPNQVGKPSKRPTMNWVNQCFEGIDLICHTSNGCVRYVFVRMSDFVKKVLHFLGENYVKRYSVAMLI